MKIQGFQIKEEIQSENPYRCFRAKNNTDETPVLIKISSKSQTRFSEIELFKKDHLIGLSLSKGCSQVLKPIELNHTDNITYLTYEDFNGITLKEILQRHPLDIKNVLSIAIELSKALGHMHQQKLIHKNLNTSNILVNPDTYEIKLLDFRNASEYGLKPKKYNHPNRNIDLRYISPELTGRLQYDIDYRSDYYTLGIILFELLTGTTPFGSNDPMEMIHSHIARLPKPITKHSVSCPQILSDITLKLLSKMPSERYQSSIGIQKDLKHCLHVLAEKGELLPFTLAEYDFSNNFTLSNVFYGRDNDIEQLDVALKNIATHNFITITGGIGVGKTALVEEWERRNQSDFFFVQGKHGQYEKDYPYSAFIQIIEGLTKYLLSQSESEFNKYHLQLQSRLGNNSGVITQLVPYFETIIGKQPKPIILGAAESRNRFIEAISALLSIFAVEAKPLVIFIDDLQWADKASLELLDSLLDADWMKNALFIGTCRNAKPDKNKMLKVLFNDLKTGEMYSEINLLDLNIDMVSKFIAETLRTDVESINPLAQYTFNVTQGNIFYLRQLLFNMYQDGLIWANEKSQKWCWDISKKESDIENQDINKLLDSMIDRLNKDQLLLLKYAQCMGESFNVSDLAYVLDISEDDIVFQMAPMLSQALLNVNTDSISFRHDEIQQALSKKYNKNEFQKIHSKIGQKILKRYQSDLSGERLLAVTNHLNKSESLLENIEDVDKLLELNYLSAQNTLQNCAYSLALDYSSKAISLLGKVSADFKEKFYFNVKIKHARCLYLNARHKEARDEINIIFETSDSLKQKSICYSLLKDILVSEESNFNEAVKIGLKILQSADITVAEDGEQLLNLIADKNSQIAVLMKGKAPIDLLDYPLLTNEDKKCLLGVLIDLWEAAYYDANEPLMQYSILSAVVISLEHGHTSESSFAYVFYGMMLTMEGNYREAYNFGEMALKLNEKFDDEIMLPKVTNLFCNYINYHVRPFDSSTALYTKSADIGQQNGDYLFGLWASIFVIWSRLLANDNLFDVLNTSGKLKSFIKQTHDSKMIYVQDLLENVIGALKGKDNNGKIITIDDHDDFIQYWQKNNFLPGITWRAILLGQYYCVLGEFDKAHELLNQEELATSPSLIMFPHTQLVFYKTLSLLKLSNRDELSLTNDQVKTVNDNISLMSEWADICPENFLSQLNLLQAEKKCYDEMLWDAAVLYRKAIESGIKYNTLCNVALSNELASEFWGKHGDAQLSKYHLKCAASYYDSWGAEHKSALLLTRLGGEEKLITTAAQVKENDISSDALNITSDLDLDTVLKFTQAISDEVNQEKLISKSMNIILENAGADKGVFISVKNTELIVKVIAEYQSDELNINYIDMPLDKVGDLPCRTINYVHRSKDVVASDSPDFSEHHQDEKYLKENNIKCFSCVPITHNEDLIGILYLENKSTFGIFDESRIKIIGMLVSQLATSLQNAALYNSLNDETILHKETSAALKGSEERLRLSHLYSNLGVWDWNIVTNDLYWNEMIAPMFGGPKFEMVTSYENFINAVHPDDQHLVSEAIQNCFNGEKYKVEHRVIWQDGTIRWVHETGDVTRNEKGDPIRMLGIVSDVTERRKTEENLRRAQQRLLLHREQSPVGIVEWTPDFEVVAWNPAAKKIFGYSKEELMGKGFLDLIAPKNDLLVLNDIWEALLANKGGTHSINENVTKDGRVILCEWHNTPLIDGDGNVIGVSAIVEDITEKQKKEENERQMQKMDAIGQLTGGIAHDFNNMLGVILGFSGLLKKSLDGENPKQLKYCDQILKAGDRAKNLTSNLLQFSSTATPSEETININILLADMKHMLETTLTHRIKLGFELKEDLWSIYLDKGQLEDAILNMSINAMHAMPEGGKLTLNSSTSHLTKQQSDQLGLPAGDYVVLSIADTGSGIAPEVQQKIFDPFFTTKGTEGTGLGLSQVYGFVQQAGGTIEVISEVGQGTILKLYFPRCDENKDTDIETDASTAAPVELAQSNDTILVVDDEEALLSLNEAILTDAGYNVLVANGAEQALEHLKNNSVDLMLSDVIMPEVNGYQLAAEVEKLYPDVKVQMVSGYSEDHNKNAAHNKLYQQRLSKPVEEDVLLRRIAEMLDTDE